MRKKVYKKWRRMSVAGICGIVATVMLSGCVSMSDAEKEKVKQYEKQALGMIWDYVWEEYHTIALIKDRNTLTERTPNFIGITETATPYVEAKIVTFGKEFYVVCNVETGKCYDNYYAKEQQEQIIAYMSEALGMEEAEYIACWFNPHVIEECYKVAGDFYWSADEKFSPEKMLKSGAYDVSVLVEDTGGFTPLEESTYEDILCADAGEAEKHITYADYRKNTVCGEGLLTAEQCTHDDFLDAEMYGYANKVYSIEVSGGEDTKEPEITERVFVRKKVNDVIITWEANRCTVTLKKCVLRELQEDEKQFIPVNETGIRLMVEQEKLGELERNYIYIFYEKPKRGYSYVAVNGTDADELWINSLADVGYSYIETERNSSVIDIGLYEEID